MIGQYVLVTTKHRGVFAGALKEYDKDAERLTLEKAKCAIYWSTKKGFLELASHGPNDGSKIGAEAPEIELNGVTSVSLCTDEAKERWENA